MVKRQYYYAIVGSNGYGLFYNWNECYKWLKYFKKSVYEVFNDVESAHEWICEESIERAANKYYAKALHILDYERLLERKVVFYSKDY